MDQSALPLDILSTILMIGLSPSHKLICKSVYQVFKERHPFKQWVNSIIHEIEEKTPPYVSYMVLDSPISYAIWDISKDQPTKLINGIRVGAIYNRAYVVKDCLQDKLLANTQVYDGGLKVLEIKYNKLAFIADIPECNIFDYHTKYLVILNRSIKYLLEVFNDLPTY